RLVSCAGSQVKIWASEPAPDAPQVEHRGVVSGLQFSPDGKRLFIASASISGINGGLEILDVASGRTDLALDSSAATQSVYDVTPDMRCLLMAHEDRRLLLWDLETGSERWRSDLRILWASWSHEPERPARIVAQTLERTCKIVDPEDGRVIGELP